MRYLTIPAIVIAVMLPALASAAHHTVRDAIEAANGEVSAAINSGDGAAAASHYTAEARILPPGGALTTGREAIGAFWQGAIDGGLSNFVLRTLDVEAMGDTAHEVGAFTLDVAGSDGTVATVAGKYVVIWKRGADGAWRIHVDIWNTDPAPSAE